MQHIQTCTCGSNRIVFNHSDELKHFAYCEDCGNLVYNCENRVEAIDYWNMSQIINKKYY